MNIEDTNEATTITLDADDMRQAVSEYLSLLFAYARAGDDVSHEILEDGYKVTVVKGGSKNHSATNVIDTSSPSSFDMPRLTEMETICVVADVSKRP